GTAHTTMTFFTIGGTAKLHYQVFTLHRDYFALTFHLSLTSPVSYHILSQKGRRRCPVAILYPIFVHLKPVFSYFVSLPVQMTFTPSGETPVCASHSVSSSALSPSDRLSFSVTTVTMPSLRTARHGEMRLLVSAPSSASSSS